MTINRTLKLGRRSLILSTGANTADRRVVITRGGGVTLRGWFPIRRFCLILVTRPR